MKRQISSVASAAIAAALALALVVAGCSGGSGGLGTLPPTASGQPSLPVSSPDATPGGGSPSPTGTPGTPGTPGISPAPTAAPSGTPGSPTATPGSPAGSPAATPAPTPTAPPSQGASMVVRAYFYLDGQPRSAGLVPVLRTVPQTVAVARAAILELLAGPSAAERDASPGIASAVPAGTELLGISIEGGIATIDLSGEFASGGGSMSMSVRLAQVVYTLTQFPTVERVVFWLDGRLVTVFGSEGIVLEGPVGRADYRDLLPAIWIDRPAWGAAVGNPARISGLANVFEAQFQVALLDASGRPVLDEPVMATCGTGCWGTVDVTLDYQVAGAQWGTLRVYALSAADGSVELVRDYPVWLTPRS